ncbi:MAG: hypothetical protein EA386_03810 [Rhodobacteraceae bacterium]|nr:MAG: hypothetical protein EA386_03810 [Paracoccaceae bacterium]
MSMTQSSRNSEDDSIAPTVARQIDENLRRLYDDAAGEDLPKGLSDLLDALRKQDSEDRAG